MGIIEVILIIGSLWASCETSHRIRAIEIELKYGTFPSDMFPDDPRHKPETLLDYCGW